MTIIVTQGVMVVASLVAMYMAERRSYWLVILFTFLTLPIRDLVAASVIQDWAIYPVQSLDGVGAGLQSVAVPGLVARIERRLELSETELGARLRVCRDPPWIVIRRAGNQSRTEDLEKPEDTRSHGRNRP